MRLKNSKPNRGGGIIMNSNDLAVAADISKNILFSQLRALENSGGLVGSVSSKSIMSPSYSESRRSGGHGKPTSPIDSSGKWTDSSFQGKLKLQWTI